MDAKPFVIIGFSTRRGFSLISKAVQLVERTPYSHVYVRFYEADWDRWVVYHASHHNLHYLSFETFSQENVIIKEYRIDTTKELYKKARQLCIDWAGRKYGKLQLFGMLLARIMRCWFGLKVRNPFRDDRKTQVCSELGGMVAISLGLSVDADKLEVEGPRWLDDVMMRQPGVKRIV